MKALGAVRHQVKQVSFRHLKKKLEEGLRTRPANCAHNRVMHHPKLVADGGGPCGVCICPLQEGDVLCDPAWGGIVKAKGCSLYKPVADKDTLKAGFKEWLSTAQIHEVAAEYPDLAALLWVLQDEAPGRDVEIPDDADWEPEQETEEEFTLEFAGVTLRVSSVEDVEMFNLAVESAADEVATLRTNLDAAKHGLETMTEDHTNISQTAAELRLELADRPELPVPRVSWWARLLGRVQ